VSFGKQECRGRADLNRLASELALTNMVKTAADFRIAIQAQV